MRARGCIALWMALAAAAAAEPTLEVSPSRESLYLGESLILEIKVGGSSRPDAPDVSRIANCRVEFLGSQDISHQTIVIVNGQMRREGFTGRTFHYKVTPTREGRMTLGPVTANVEGTPLSTAGPVIHVTGIEAQDVVAISVTPSRDAVLVDEPFDVRLAVRIRKLPDAYAEFDPLLREAPPHLDLPFLRDQPGEGLEGPDIRSFLNGLLTGRDQPGFAINDFTVQPDMLDFGALFGQRNVPARFKLERQPVEVNGRACWEYAFTLRYTAVKEATHTFGPILFKGRVPTEVRRDGSAAAREIFAVGPAAIVRVVPPPETGRPDSYVGAIGTGLSVEAALDAQTCNVGDPLTLTLSITGPVQIRNLFPPKLGLQPELVSRFEVYDDSVKTSRRNGTLVCQYILRPRASGAMELPPVEVAYYDTASRQYKVITTAPIPLKVRQAAEITASQVIGGATNRPAADRPAADRLAALANMAPAGVRMGPAGVLTKPILPEPGRWLLVIAAGPLLFAVTAGLRALRRHWPSLRAALRRRRALSVCSRRLRQAARNPAAFHASACRAFRQYLEMRLGVSSTSLTPDEARAQLRKHRVPETVAARFSACMQEHFDNAFATGAAVPGAPDAGPSLAALRAVDGALRNPGAAGHPVSASLLLIPLALLCGSLDAATDPNREFLWNEANAAMSSARRPQEFLDAAATYQKLADLGARNSDLFFNQGTALLLAGKYDDAAAVLLRAERHGGSQPDIRRNLAIAWGHAAGLKTPFTPWSRTLLFWHYRPPCAARAALAVIAFALVWLLATLRLTGWRRGSKTLLWIAILVFVLAGSSVLTSVIQESQTRRPASLRATAPEVP